MALIRFKRGTRAQLEAAATAAQLQQAEPYYVTDENTLAVGSGTSKAISLATGSAQTFSATAGGSIQAALDAAASAGGGIVVVEAGAWVITQTLLIYSNTTIRLHPQANILRGAEIDCMIRNGTVGVALYGANSNIVIDGGVWDGNKAVYTSNCCSMAFGHCDNVIIQNAVIKDAPGWHLIELNAVQNGMVQRCVLSGLTAAGKEAIQLDLMKGSGQYPWDTNFDNTPCHSIRLLNNIITDCTRGVGSHSSTAGKYHSDVIVEHNVFRDLTEEAIYTEDWANTVISNNSFERVVKAIHIRALSNTIRNITISGNIIKDCTDGNTEGRGVQVEGVNGGVSVQNGSIVHNQLNDIGRHAIGVDYSDGWNISNNQIDTVYRVPIWVYGSADCIVANNAIKNVGDYYTPKRGIQLGPSSSSTPRTIRTVVTGNNTEAIITDYATDTIITGNIVHTTLTDGGNALDTQMYNNLVNGTWAP
jgi:hypothetical protein